MKPLMFILLFLLMGIILRVGASAHQTIINHTVIVDANKHRAAGIIVDKNLVLTVFHPALDRPHIFVNGVPAEIIFAFVNTDAMVLKTKQSFPKEWIVTKWATKWQLGEPLWIVGHPQNFQHSVFQRNISWIKKGYFRLDNHLQEGFSGGGAFNVKQELVGIAIGVYLDGHYQGVGKIISVDAFKQEIDHIKNEEK